MSFSIKQSADLNALNVSKGKGDEAPVCATISLIFAQALASAVAAAFGCTEQDLDALFVNGGGKRFGGLESMDTCAQYKDAHTLEFGEFAVDVAKVSKIRVSLLDQAPEHPDPDADSEDDEGEGLSEAA